MKSKFDLLFEQLMTKTITTNTFDFQFKEDENGKLTCEFETLKNDKLQKVTAEINNSDIIFNIDNETLSEKEFMMKFFKDYKLFKDALSEFKYDKLNNVDKQSDENTNETNIEPFDKKLNKEVTGDKILVNNITFVFKEVEDEIKDLFQVNFEIANEDTETAEEMPLYRVTCVLKKYNSNNKNLIPVKFIFRSAADDEVIQELSKSDFKNKYEKIYFSLINAINEYEDLKEVED